MHMEMEWGLLLLVLLLLSLVWGLLLWWWNEIRYIGPIKARCSNFKLPPGHLGFPFIGEMISFSWHFKILGCPDGFIHSKIIKYGRNVGVYRTYLFGCPSIIACSPSVCKFVLHSSNDDFVPAWSKSIMGPNSILTLHGARHHIIKNFVMNFINRPDSLGKLALHIQPNITSALQSWSQRRQIKAFEEFKKITLDYMRRYLVSCDLGMSTDALAKLFAGISQGFRAEPLNIPGTAYYYAIQCRKKLIKILRDELLKRKQEKHKTKIMSTTNDFMDGLMEMKDKEGKPLSDEEVLDNVLLIIQLSHTTISYAMPWSLYFLAKSPHVLLKLRVIFNEENMHVSQMKNGECLTYEDFSKLKYTLKVVEEIIRLANISSFLFRKVTRDIKYEGYIIPKDWNVIVWQRYLHIDPKNYDDPLCFNPERWNKRPKYGAFFPFGGGVKTCAGNMVARLNLVAFIHHLSIGYKWELINPDMPIKYLAYPHLADGLEVSFSKILKNSNLYGKYN